MGYEGIPSNFSKGPVHQAVDAQLNYKDENGNYAKRSEILNLLSNEDNNYIDLLKTVFQVPTGAADYVAEHWFNPNPDARQTWWKEKQPLEPIIRRGLICAIEMAEDLPIESCWIPIGNREVHPNNYEWGVFRTDEYPFEVILVRGDYQLSRIIVTPPSPRPMRLEMYTQPTDVWVVKSRYDLRPAGRTQTFGKASVTQLYERPDAPPGNYNN